MEFNSDFQRLRAENELLLGRLLDLDTLIQVREEELQMLRELAEEGRRLRSKLDTGVYEVDHLRKELEDARLREESLESRSGDMERELLGSIKTESQYQELLAKSDSMRAEVEFLQNELAESSLLNEKFRQLEDRLAELSSRLKIAEVDRESLRQELEQFRHLKKVSPEQNIE